MTSSNSSKKTLTWAVDIFRPVLQSLKIQELELWTFKTTSGFRDLFRFHMDRAVIVVRRCKFSKPDYKGIFIWQYNEKNNIFALYILLNDNLYTDTSAKTGIIRKAVSTHEFVHCTAALMTIAEMESKTLIKNQMAKLKKSFHALGLSDVQSMLNDTKILGNTSEKEDGVYFKDSHFRTGDEDFQASYSDLYKELLFSYQLFREFFTDELMREFFIALSNKDDKVKEIISSLVKEISEKKNLEPEFVEKKIRNEMFGTALAEIIGNRKLRKIIK